MAERTERTVTRLDAVKAQIDCAIRAYFLWDDLVSAIVLAGAAERVTSDKQPKDGLYGVDASSIRSWINLNIKDKHQKEAAKLFRRDYDFFRHADCNPADTHTFAEESVDLWIAVTIGSYHHIVGSLTPDMDAFLRWFAHRHPDIAKKAIPARFLSPTIPETKFKRNYYLETRGGCGIP